MKYDELLDKIDEAFKKAKPGKFGSVEEALRIVGAGLKYLLTQCEAKDDIKSD